MAFPNLILLHGALGCAARLQPLKEKLTQQFNVFSLDFSGHGGKPFHADGFYIDHFSKEVLAFMEERSLKKASFFGYSMGGYVALNLAKTHSDKVEKIFTLATKMEWTSEQGRREAANLDPDRIEEKVPKFAKALKNLHSPNSWKELVRKTADMMIDLGDNPNLKKEDLKQISIPVMITAGSLDQMVSMKECERTSALLPNATVKIFDGWKHPVEQADMAVLSEALQEFFL